MAFTRSEETALIQAIYSSAGQTGSGAWSAFLEMLANMTRADLAAVIVQMGDQKSVSVSAQNMPEWLSHVASSSDPIGLGRLRYERVYTQDDLPDCEVTLRVARAQSADGSAWLLIQRTREDFRALDSALMSFVMPHLGTAVGIWGELGRNSLDSQLKQRMTESLNGGWITFDQTGRVVDLDDFAKRMHIRPDPELIRQVIGTQSPQAVSMGEIDILLTPFACDLTPAQSSIACIGLIRNTNPLDSPDPNALATTLDIAKAEARLAASLAQGLSLSESAEALNLTIETARNYSKRIFAQTGLKGQPDLVRRVLNGVGRFR